MDPRRSDTTFVVRPWEWSSADRTLTCRYTSPLGEFAERITFPAGIEPTDGAQRAFDLLSVACGTSYFKAAPSQVLSVETMAATQVAAGAFVTALYDHGLREYAVRNGFPVPFTTVVELNGHRPALPVRTRSGPGGPRLLVPMGGGRDSAVVATALVSLQPTLFTVGANPYVVRQAERLGLRLISAARAIDQRLLAANDAGALNGHVPVTAINSLIAVATAEMGGHDAVVMSNEASADSPTLVVDGVPVNHQFSKSSAFEALLRATMQTEPFVVDYFSALRPYGELDIARAFATGTQLLGEIMSCNRAFVRDAAKRSAGWCGTCAKCRFVFLTLAPFVDRSTLTATFGRDLLASLDELDATAELFVPNERPFDCVGTAAEARRAVRAVAAGQWADSPLVRQLAQLESDLAPSPEPPPAADHTPAAVRELVSRLFA